MVTIVIASQAACARPEDHPMYLLLQHPMHLYKPIAVVIPFLRSPTCFHLLRLSCHRYRGGLGPRVPLRYIDRTPRSRTPYQRHSVYLQNITSHLCSFVALPANSFPFASPAPAPLAMPRSPTLNSLSLRVLASLAGHRDPAWLVVTGMAGRREQNDTALGYIDVSWKKE